ncbi:SDR family NAD(P)-dependent oxidoreductase [Rhodococcus erythropolis]
MFSLENRVAVVTGAASGMGLAIVRRFIAAGAHVAMFDRADGNAIAEEVGASFHRVDVADEASVAAACDAVADRYGRIDVMVNNAGVFDTASIEASSDDDWTRQYRVNTLGPLHGIKHATRHMPAGGTIINTSSVAALLGFPEYGGYSASKSGVVALTKVAALEYGSRGIRVNCICPGSVETPMLASQDNAAEEAGLVTVASPIGRTIMPEEIAALVHFLASNDCGAVTGAIIPVEGGLTSGYTPALAEAAIASLQTTR